MLLCVWELVGEGPSASASVSVSVSLGESYLPSQEEDEQVTAHEAIRPAPSAAPEAAATGVGAEDTAALS